MTVEEIIVWSAVPMLCGVIFVQVIALVFFYPKLKKMFNHSVIGIMIYNSNIVIMLSVVLITIIVMLYRAGFKISMI